MSLSDELLRVRDYLSGTNPPPSNEANTCNRVIRPLLQNCGYDHDDIDEQGHDAAGGIPDYILLPHTPHTWFLEAKKWAETLNAIHATQACDYPSRQGKRWVVLSNGREWRLYDNFIVGVPPTERLVVTAKLDCGGQLEALLGALSKASVEAGALEEYAAKMRLTSLLDQQLRTPNSEVLAAIRTVLRTKFGLASVTPADIAAYFHSVPASPAPPLSPVSAVPAPVPAPSPPVNVPPTLSGVSMTLRELKQANTVISYGSPDSLVFPDGTVQPVVTWRDVATGVIGWLFERGKIPPMPFTEQKHGKRFFINTSAHFGVTDRHEHKTVTVQGQVYYVHVNRSRTDFMRCLIALCEEVGESADGFRVTLK